MKHAKLLKSLVFGFGLLMSSATEAATYYYTSFSPGGTRVVSSTSSATLVKSTSKTWSGTMVVSGNVTITDRVEVSSGTDLILLDGSELTCEAGIHVTDNKYLYVTAGNTTEDIQGTGLLISTVSSNEKAAIGGNQDEAGGVFVIYDGNVIALNSYKGPWNGPGSAVIGGGYQGLGGMFRMRGGTLTAYTDYSNGGAIIGGGTGGSGGTIEIYDGTLVAYNGGGGTAATGAILGGGWLGAGGNISISGGDITVYSKYDESTNSQVTRGAAIGGGSSGAGGTINISGGTITAYGGWNANKSSGVHDIGQDATVYGAVIGGGENADGGTINITGGTIKAVGAYTYEGKVYGAVIGGGQNGGCGTINISGGTIEAYSAYNCCTGISCASTIGCGYEGSGGTITIDGTANIKAWNNTSETATVSGPALGDYEDATCTIAIKGNHSVVNAYSIKNVALNAAKMMATAGNAAYYAHQDYGTSESGTTAYSAKGTIDLSTYGTQKFNCIYFTTSSTGIERLEETEAASTVYDLQGRQHSCLQNGLNIVNGRKIIKK